jgi:hypothetical protein
MSTQLLFTKMIFCNKIADNYREQNNCGFLDQPHY